MDPVGMTFLALLGVVVAGAWVSFGGRSARPAPPRHRATPTPVVRNPDSIFGGIADRWTSDVPTVVVPRVSRRGFGTHLAATPVRPRRWSQFAYSGMWSEWRR